MSSCVSPRPRYAVAGTRPRGSFTLSAVRGENVDLRRDDTRADGQQSRDRDGLARDRDGRGLVRYSTGLAETRLRWFEASRVQVSNVRMLTVRRFSDLRSSRPVWSSDDLRLQLR